MNYRQWKKNYKKQHGYNPPISEDKRKQAKLMAQQLTVTLPEITEAMKNFVSALFRALAEASETLSKGFASTSRAFESMAETYNTHQTEGEAMAAGESCTGATEGEKDG